MPILISPAPIPVIIERVVLILLIEPVSARLAWSGMSSVSVNKHPLNSLQTVLLGAVVQEKL